jgi:hypothetical protein
LNRLVAIARERGVQGFVGYVLADNVRMLRVFHRSGLPVVSTLAGGVYTVTLRFAGGDAGPGRSPVRAR